MPSHPSHLDALLRQHLGSILGELEPEAIALLVEHLQWVEFPGGATLMAEGEPGDAMYLVVSGRLRAYQAGDDGRPRMVREIARGQVVGEMSLYTDEPRSATIVAIRDTVLVRLGKAQFKQLLAISAQVSMAITRQIIARLKSEHGDSTLDRPTTIGLLPVSEGVDAADFAERLAAQLRPIGSVAVVDRQRVSQGMDGRGPDDAEANRRIALRLDEIEAAHDFVLLVADPTPTPWTVRCSRHSDELLLLADADQAPQLHPTETECLVNRPRHTEAAEILVLLHPADRLLPRDTRAWLARRPLTDHVHVRPVLDRDMARLARLQSRTAVGLVLAGGAARGLAHLGVYRALIEHGIEVDVVGGTSIGAVMAAYVASDRPLEPVMANARRAFALNPTGDFNLIPMLSLIKGQRLRRVVGQAQRDLLGHDADIEDLWKGYYCVASNYSKACEQVQRGGPLLKAMLASMAIPGALPPVIDGGDLLCDGGTFNNFPVDVMRGLRGVGKVIGVDLSAATPRHYADDRVPGTWALLRDSLRPRSRRRYKLPSLPTYLINVTILNSSSRQTRARRLTDLYFNPPLLGVAMLAWNRFESIVEKGYLHACEVLDGHPPARPTPPAAAPEGLLPSGAAHEGFRA